MQYNKLHASDILETGLDWVCLELQSFKCIIDGVPRPDISTNTSGIPLDGDLNNPSVYSRAASRSIQRQVMAQIGSLTKLQEISLGQDVISRPEDFMFLDDGFGDDDDEELAATYQYQCLSMTLEDGLDLLKDLKFMRRMFLERMSDRLQSAVQEWIQESWPDFGKESRDSFWTERGHSCEIGAGFIQRGVSTADWHRFDWW